MKYVNFQNDKISKLSLGTVQFGMNYGIANKDGKPKEQNMQEIVNYLYLNGINSFDTASSYGNSEERLGKIFKNLDKLYVVSKLSSEIFLEKAQFEVQNTLNKLNINSLFGLLLHDGRLLNNWNKKCENIVLELQKKGLINNFGISIYTSEEFNKALENEFIEFIQIPFNIFDLRAVRENWFEKAKAKNKLIFIRSIFLQGLLLMDIKEVPKKLEKSKIYLKKFYQLSEKFGMTKSQLALSFIDSVAKDSILLFGCENMIQAKENLKNYKNLELLSKENIDEIIENFQDIDENVYLPTRW